MSSSAPSSPGDVSSMSWTYHQQQQADNSLPSPALSSPASPPPQVNTNHYVIVNVFMMYLQRGAKKISPCLKFLPHFCQAKWPAHAQPIGPNGTWVTKLSSINFARPCTRGWITKSFVSFIGYSLQPPLLTAALRLRSGNARVLNQGGGSG